MSERSRDRPQRHGGPEGAHLVAMEAQLRAEAAAVRRAERRFEKALLSDAAADGAGADADVLRRLRSEPITRIGRVEYSSNAVFIIELEGTDPTHTDQLLRAVYKPSRGERPLWDFPRQTLHLREVAAYVVSAALGDGIIPPTALREGPHGPGSVQLFVHGANADATIDRGQVEEQLRAVAALDVLINNADRKRAHLLLGDDGRLYGIDNALSFLPYPHQRTVLLELGGDPLPDAVVGRVRGLAGDDTRRGGLRERLERLLDPAEVLAFDQRLDSLAAEAVYPRLDPWEGRPFEWW